MNVLERVGLVGQSGHDPAGRRGVRVGESGEGPTQLAVEVAVSAREEAPQRVGDAGRRYVRRRVAESVPFEHPADRGTRGQVAERELDCTHRVQLVRRAGIGHKHGKGRVERRRRCFSGRDGGPEKRMGSVPPVRVGRDGRRDRPPRGCRGRRCDEQVARLRVDGQPRRGEPVLAGRFEEHLGLARVARPLRRQRHEPDLAERPVGEEEPAAVLLGEVRVPVARDAGRRAAAERRRPAAPRPGSTAAAATSGRAAG